MPKKVLIIEQEKTLSEIYNRKLSQEGLKPVCTEDYSQAIFFAKKEKPDLIILDILLPKETGISFLGELFKITNSPVIAFSNYDDPEIKQETKKLGVKDYLIKSDYTPNQMVEIVKKYL